MNDCQRYERIALRRAEGEAIPAEDQRFERAHRQGCDACRRMAGAEAALQDALAGDELPRDELARRRELDALLELADQAPALEVGAPGATASGLRWALAGLAVAAGLALAFWLGASNADSAALPDGAAARADAIEGARVLTALGEVRADGRSLREGQAVAEGQVLESGAGRLALKLDERVTLMLGEQARLRPEALGRDELRVVLERGQLMASVSKLPAGQRFVVSTRFGRVQVVGTVFAVSVGPRSAEVRVTEGRVLVTEPGQASRTVGQGEVALLGEPVVAALASEQRGVAADVAADARGSALAPPAGDGAAGAAPRTGPGSRLAQAPKGPAGDADEAAPQEPVATARELLDRARRLRLQREWYGAAAAYGELLEHHPQSSEAAAALVALGEVQLEHLESPVQALESFEAYLARGEQALAPEAAFGRARALRVLLRRDDERKALKQFLQTHPDAAQVEQARRRLRVLGEE